MPILYRNLLFKPVVNFEVKTTTTVPSTTTQASTTHKSFSTEEPLYRLDGSNGQACILLQVDALITVTYRTKLGEDQVRLAYELNSEDEREIFDHCAQYIDG